MLTCTVIIPTRFRPDGLAKTIQSILSTAKKPKEIEVVVRVHSDDSETRKAMPKIKRLGNVSHFLGTNLGFGGEAIYCWELSQRAQGKWIWGMSDDITVSPDSQHWDMKLKDIPDRAIGMPQINCLGGSTYHEDTLHPCCFLPNRWWEQFNLEHFCHPTDAFIYTLLRNAGWSTHFIPGLITHHDQQNDKLRKSEGRHVA